MFNASKSIMFFPGRIITLEDFEIFHKSIGRQHRHNLAKKLVSRVRESKKYKEYIRKPQVGHDGLAGAIRHIEWIYHDFPLPILDESHDQMEMQSLLFFQYLKYFIEVLKHSFPNFIIDSTFCTEVNELRNIFSHSYKKEIPGVRLKGGPYFIRLDLNPHLCDGTNIEVMNLDTGKKDLDIRFSLDYYYLQFQQLTMDFISNQIH